MLTEKLFKNCDSQYRSAPFWSWNDTFDTTELVKQIGEMHKQGIGGFFMHPRCGMKDEYFGERYITAVRTCIEEADRLGMKAWLYDEDWCPSGGAAGMVVSASPDFRQKAIAMYEMQCRDINKSDDILGIFTYDKQDDHDSFTITDITALSEDTIRQMEGDALVFKVVYGPAEAVWNNQSYTDLCYKAAIDRFIEVTHQRYKTVIGDSFGKVVPGIFTDEPNFSVHTFNEKKALPWTYELEKIFKSQKGYDLADCLPSLFLKTGQYKKVRFDYWDVLSRQFVQSFTKNIHDWCEENNLLLTGHYWEHGFPVPTHTGSVMPNYEYMQYPGIDMLFNTSDEIGQFGNVAIVKEVSSVANQLGKERVLSETYGASGWDLNFEDMKRIADWQFALGVNFVCQHLVLYSLKGYRKRDFPLSFLYHQPWWDCYRPLGDYIGRLSYVMSQGTFVGDILVLHPYSSAWAEFDMEGDKAWLDEIETSFKSLNKALSELHYFFDLGDDTLMEKYAQVEGNCIMVGKMAYSTVILPSMSLLRSSTLKLLQEFAQNGGKIVVSGHTPHLLDGVESDELKKFFDSGSIVRTEGCKTALREVLAGYGNRCAAITDTDGKDTSAIYCHKRQCDGNLIYFLCNLDKSQSLNIELELEGSYHTEEWDAVTGDVKVLDVYSRGTKRFALLDFPPVASCLLVVDTSRVVETKQPSPSVPQPVECIQLSQWKATRVNNNSYTLKRCKYMLDGREWSAVKDVLNADTEIKELCGMEVGGLNSRPPWMHSQDERDIRLKLKAEYTFNVSESLKGDLYVALESPEEYDVYINGCMVSPCGKTHFDRAFAMCDIKDYVRCGENTILLSTDRYGLASNLEHVYVVGDFILVKVEDSFTLKNETDGIVPGDWTKQGYPYYSGAVRYTTGFDMDSIDNKRVVLVLDRLWMAAAKIYVNGREAAVLAWKPYEADITACLQQGWNEVVVEVKNTLQNLLGPHNDNEPEGIAHPGSFYYGNGDVRFAKSGFEGKGAIRVYNL